MLPRSSTPPGAARCRTKLAQGVARLVGRLGRDEGADGLVEAQDADLVAAARGDVSHEQRGVRGGVIQ